MDQSKALLDEHMFVARNVVYPSKAGGAAGRLSPLLMWICKSNFLNWIFAKMFLCCVSVTDGRTDPILDDVGDAFKLMGVNLHELEDYIHNIEPVTFAHQIPSFPVSKNNVLQFPQPGSKDAEERKEYIPDYLPPIVSSQEGAELSFALKFGSLCVYLFVCILEKFELRCPVVVAQEGSAECYTSVVSQQCCGKFGFTLLLSSKMNWCQTTHFYNAFQI